MNKFNDDLNSDDLKKTSSSTERNWFDHPLLIGAFLLFGFFISMKNFILAYRNWEPISMFLCGFWILVFLFFLKRLISQNRTK